MVNEMKFYYKDYKNAIQIQGIIPAYDIDFYFSSKKQYEQFKEDYKFSQPKELKVKQALNMLPEYKKGLDKGRKEGAIEELKDSLTTLKAIDSELDRRNVDMMLKTLIKVKEKRLKELEKKVLKNE